MAMYNRYRGNSGRPEKVAEPKEQNRRPPPPPPRPAQKKPPNQMPLLGGSLARLIPEKLGELETEGIKICSSSWVRCIFCNILNKPSCRDGFQMVLKCSIIASAIRSAA